MPRPNLVILLLACVAVMSAQTPSGGGDPSAMFERIRAEGLERSGVLHAFNPIHDYVGYDVWTHHTNVDSYERVREEDLKQNAVRHRVVRLARAMMDGTLRK